MDEEADERKDVTVDMVNVAKLANSVLLNAEDSKQRDLSLAAVFAAINGDTYVCR
tara:strand:+ start:542 stop:706 length:165 start_codon:yes stop_codon:yes gene_type:complete